MARGGGTQVQFNHLLPNTIISGQIWLAANKNGLVVLPLVKTFSMFEIISISVLFDPLNADLSALKPLMKWSMTSSNPAGYSSAFPH